MTDVDHYQKIGLMVGLELHQQLNTNRKLYCHCSTTIRDDEPDGLFVRRLRPTQSELGAIDPAALFEFQKKKRFCYEYYNDTTCLVEADEEPPHNMDEDSIDICLTMSNFMNSTPVNEIHPMRKIVIDGSNTTGFQRTAIIALGGTVLVDDKKIGIQTVCLEEDAARKIADDDKNNTRIYRLDRLGIPLIEIATAPDINTPLEAQNVAQSLGLLLRSTGKVKRGLGTIRQDVNISIKGGGIIEVKGLQQLDMLATVVEYEALRQEHLLEISKKLVRKGVTESDFEVKPVNVSHIFVKSESNVIRNALKSDGKVYALKLPGFAGLVGTEIQPERRLGTEFSDYAQFWGGVGGIFHTDELPKYGITTSNVSQLRKFLGAKEQDALIIVAAAEENCIDALNAVVERAKDALIGVPAETRTPLPNGTTKYARPRPGAERMYPETDVRPVKITESRLKRITKEMPETLESKEKRFVKEHGLSEELASQVVRSYNLELFEQIVADIDIAPTIIASTLENTLVSLHRDGAPSENLQDRHFIELFGAVSNNTVSSDAIPEILTYLSNNPDSGFEEALSSTGLGKIETTEVEKIIQKIVEQKIDFIREQGERATGALMGIAMKELRGKADGK
ncbi:MAG: Glu-tRNA(Gln) amidotransferase subunit GatE [Candidatus Thorarchaeota archaeon]|jgi:glutamyl-tRNA(Gln) amidotransferase subunit E